MGRRGQILLFWSKGELSECGLVVQGEEVQWLVNAKVSRVKFGGRWIR